MPLNFLLTDRKPATITQTVREFVRLQIDDMRKHGGETVDVKTETVVDYVAKFHDSTSEKQLRDYVCYVLRESPHVRRYATGVKKSYRRIHKNAECGSACKAHDATYEYPITNFLAQAAGAVITHTRTVQAATCVCLLLHETAKCAGQNG